MDREMLPLAGGAIDVAVINGIFNLNPRRGKIFKELARVIRKRGRVFAAELILKAPLPPEIQEVKVRGLPEYLGPRRAWPFWRSFARSDFEKPDLFERLEMLAQRTSGF